MLPFFPEQLTERQKTPGQPADRIRLAQASVSTHRVNAACWTPVLNCRYPPDVGCFIQEMSEFKFACPVCGQHITADSTASGKPLECPTCFQKMIAPQAPLSGDPKLILSGSKVPTRPSNPQDGADPGLSQSKLQNLKGSLVPLALLIITGGIALLLWHNELSSLANGLAERAAGPVQRITPPTAFSSPHPVPTNVSWTLNLTNALIPNVQAAGRIHGHGFLCEHATFKAGRLSLRQGPLGAPDLAVTVSLGLHQPELLSGKAVVVTPTNPVPAPRVVLRWKDDQAEPVSQHLHSGYALRIVFGTIAEGRIRGRIFIALPDEQKSFAAGNFAAEIVQPNQPLAGK